MVATGTSFLDGLEQRLDKLDRYLERFYWDLSVLEDHIKAGRMTLTPENHNRLAKIKARIDQAD